jgi:hypothetical protein
MFLADLGVERRLALEGLDEKAVEKAVASLLKSVAV